MKLSSRWTWKRLPSSAKPSASHFRAVAHFDRLRQNHLRRYLAQKAVNLGDALDGVPGIHASQYGGGASAPVIRGQTGRRIKVLNHHGETGDMADFSPDHALMVDTALSQQVEILRGPVTLLYSSGNGGFGRCCRRKNP